MHVCSPYLTANSVVWEDTIRWLYTHHPVSNLLGFGFESNFVFTHQLPSVSQPKTRWWFQIFFIFTPIWGNDPIYLENMFHRFLLEMNLFREIPPKKGETFVSNYQLVDPKMPPPCNSPTAMISLLVGTPPLHSLKLTASSPLRIGLNARKERIVFQSSIFRC